MKQLFILVLLLVVYDTFAQSPKLLKIQKLVDKGKYSNAIAAIDKQLDGQQSAELYHLRGFSLSQLGQAQEALDDLNKSISLNPAYSLAYLDRGFTHFLLGNSQRAIDDFTVAIQLDLNFAEAYLNRGTVKFESGDAQGACDDWQMALQLGLSMVKIIILENCDQ